MQLVIIFGPPAVGKLTVGKELAKLTGFRVLHKQNIFDLLDDFFFFSSDHYRRVARGIRRLIVEEACRTSYIKGLIMTYVWSFNDPADTEFIDDVSRVVKEQGGEVYFVELTSPQEERLERVESEERRKAHKVSSEVELKDFEKGKLFSSNPEYFEDKNYILLDTSKLTPEKCALAINQAFHFAKID